MPVSLCGDAGSVETLKVRNGKVTTSFLVSFRNQSRALRLRQAVSGAKAESSREKVGTYDPRRAFA